MKRSIIKTLIILIVFIQVLAANKVFAANIDFINISKCEISSIENYEYTGKKIRPKLILKYKNVILKKDQDYTVQYKSNKKVGKSTIIITGKGKYKGKIKKNFYILPPKTRITKLTVTEKKAIINWKKSEYADGYVIYMSNSRNGKYKKIKSIKNENILTYTKYKLDDDKEYYFKIRSFSNIDGKKIYSNAFSNIKCGGGVISEKILISSTNIPDRNVNLKIASKKINGIILKPGQKFKWSKTVGRILEVDGYREAIAYLNGSDILSIGGGICQVSTGLYQCAKISGLKIIERHEHGKEVTYIENGEDATVTYGVRDLIFKNNKSYSIKIVADSYENVTICRFYKIGD